VLDPLSFVLIGVIFMMAVISAGYGAVGVLIVQCGLNVALLGNVIALIVTPSDIHVMKKRANVGVDNKDNF
jgi:hypothetical protein